MLSLVSVGTAVIWSRAGFVAAMVNEFTVRLSRVLLVLSVTAIVQLSYVPSLNEVEVSGCGRVTVVFPDDADDEVELPQAPPYVIVPASVELKV